MAVYEVGTLVVYGIHGMCRIVDREMRTVDRKKVEYLVLEPLGNAGSSYFVPAGNPAALAKLHPVMSREELEDLLGSEQIRQNCWIPDENARKQRYRELINGGDRMAMLQMIHSLQRHKQEQLAQGRKFHQCDENFLRDALRLIDGEFSVVLGIEPADVGKYVQDRLNA